MHGVRRLALLASSSSERLHCTVERRHVRVAKPGLVECNTAGVLLYLLYRARVCFVSLFLRRTEPPRVRSRWERAGLGAVVTLQALRRYWARRV